ncbi:MAG: ABC transporter permease [Gammaproteobacteria bacterium]|nr:ABC transporter permease [Gammaproteobacteria bacterium]
MNWLRRLLAISSKEARQLVRDRTTFGLIVGVPVMQILLFGYAINFDVRDVATVVLDQSRTALARQLIADLRATQVLGTVRAVDSEAGLRRALQEGAASIGIVIAPDLERRLYERRRPALQILVDGSQPSLENIAQGLVSSPLLQRPGTQPMARPVEIRVEYNPAKRTAVQIVPALIGVVLTLTMVVFTSMALVRERERGNLELLMTTPLTRGQLMLGKLLPYIAIGLVQTTLILLLSWWLFDVLIAGSLAELYLGALLFIAASLALGLFVSTVAQSQFQAIQMAFVTLLPSILMSGFMFPFDGMPPFAQALAQVLPLTHFNEIVRGIVLRGAVLADLQPQLGKLALFLLVTMSAALLRFHKRLD